MPHLCVIVISLGRPECLLEITEALNAQTRPPDRILFVVTGPDDLPDQLPELDLSVRPEVFITAKGTCHQRNIGLDALDKHEGIVAFLDDDYVPRGNALEAMEAAFSQFGPEIAGMSGLLIADGIKGPGLSTDEADRMIKAYKPPSVVRILKDTIGLYGCNMAVRIEDVGQIRFDTHLPLYAWQEDVDFGHRIACASGKRMVHTDAFVGVHRGVKSGRERRGIRLGYSQIANAWYLWKHNGLPGRFAWRVALRTMLANHLKLLHNEPWIDRRGRAAGNWRALRDIALGRADPSRIHDL